jgi:DNA-binding MurR/RpiR family transcriptional regulator
VRFSTPGACDIARSYDATVIGITRPDAPLCEHLDVLHSVDIPEENSFIKHHLVAYRDHDDSQPLGG